MSTNGVILRYYHDSIEIRDICNQRADFKAVEGLDKEVTCSEYTIGLSVRLFCLPKQRSQVLWYSIAGLQQLIKLAECHKLFLPILG
jgi:hypothetical protein